MNNHEATLEDMKKFVVSWWSSASLDEFVQRTGCDKRHASNLAAYLRRKGVPMKYMPPPQKGYPKKRLDKKDYATLRRIAEAKRSASPLQPMTHAEVRIQIVRLIASNGPMSTNRIALKTALHTNTVLAALQHEWFEREQDGWHVTNEARTAVIPKDENS